MILLVRNSDNHIMNVREGSDWQKGLASKNPKETKGEKLLRLQTELAKLPPTEPTQIAALQAQIDAMQTQWDAWLLRRRELCAKQFGGVASDYSTVQVLTEEENLIFPARYIEYDGESLTYDSRPPYIVVGSEITITSGWVKGNEQLLDDDVTDWSSEILAEPIYFELWYAKNTTTENISVQLLTRLEDEEFSLLPSPLEKISTAPVCFGWVDIDNTVHVGG